MKQMFFVIIFIFTSIIGSNCWADNEICDKGTAHISWDAPAIVSELSMYGYRVMFYIGMQKVNEFDTVNTFFDYPVNEHKIVDIRVYTIVAWVDPLTLRLSINQLGYAELKNVEFVPNVSNPPVGMSIQ